MAISTDFFTAFNNPMFLFGLNATNGLGSSGIDFENPSEVFLSSDKY